MADYYKVLGVPNTASQDEIKKAYRKLARKLHPDVAGPGAEDQFKEVSRAYEVLSNPDKRQQYDMGIDPLDPGSAAGSSSGGAFGFQDIFETFFGGSAARSSGPIPRTRPGQDSLARLDIDLRDAVFGARKEMDVETAVVCDTCGGNGCRPGTSPQTCSECGGTGSVRRQVSSVFGQMITEAPCPVCRGFGTVILQPCPDCMGEGRVRRRRRLAVNVPAGVQTGTRIKLTGQGEVGPGGGPAGDLYVEIRERRDPVFTRDGYDLHASVTIPMTAAALGAKISVETFDGSEEIDVGPGSQAGQTATLKGLGVGKLRSPSKARGDLIVHYDVEIPSDLDDEQAELLRHLAQLRGEEKPAPALRSGRGSGLFSRLKDAFARS